MIYIPISSIEAAEFLSRQLYKLTRPVEVRAENDVTEFYCGWHVHPETSAVVVALPETETVPVHVSADTTLLDPLLLPFVEQGAITEDDRAAIRTLIAESQGGASKPRVFVACILGSASNDARAGRGGGLVRC